MRKYKDEEERELQEDLKVFAEYEKAKVDGTLVTRPIEELWNELGLDD